MRRRAFGLLTAGHADLGRLPILQRLHVEVDVPGAVYGHDLLDVTTRAARTASGQGGELPLGAWLALREIDRRDLFRKIVGRTLPYGDWLTLLPEQRQRLRDLGLRLPVMAGGGQQESYRALGASFAITSTIHVHIKLLGGAAQQATLTMLEAGADGTTGIWTLELDTSTEATAGTAGTAPTATQVRRFPAVTASTTATGNFSAEGTTYTAINVVLLPMPTAPLIIQYPLGRELETQPTATTNGKALLMRGSTTVNCNMRGMEEFEE